MNPYTSMWTGVTPATGRRSSTSCCWTTAAPRRWPTASAAQALRCIRCSACLNVCPVYERTGGHAYGSVYPGPIGAVLSPQLTGVGRRTPTLPFASIAVRRLLRRLPGRDRHPDDAGAPARRSGRAEAEPDRRAAAMRRRRSRRCRTLALAAVRSALGPAGPAARPAAGRIRRLPPPLSRWTRVRDLPRPPQQTFRDWWGAGPMSARDEVLARIRTALGRPAAHRAGRADLPPAQRPHPADLAPFVERVRDYRAVVREVAARGSGDGAIDRRAGRAAATRVVAAPGLPPEWAPTVERSRDAPRQRASWTRRCGRHRLRGRDRRDRHDRARRRRAGRAAGR